MIHLEGDEKESLTHFAMIFHFWRQNCFNYWRKSCWRNSYDDGGDFGMIREDVLTEINTHWRSSRGWLHLLECLLMELNSYHEKIFNFWSQILSNEVHGRGREEMKLEDYLKSLTVRIVGWNCSLTPDLLEVNIENRVVSRRRGFVSLNIVSRRTLILIKVIINFIVRRRGRRHQQVNFLWRREVLEDVRGAGGRREVV